MALHQILLYCKVWYLPHDQWRRCQPAAQRAAYRPHPDPSVLQRAWESTHRRHQHSRQRRLQSATCTSITPASLLNVPITRSTSAMCTTNPTTFHCDTNVFIIVSPRWFISYRPSFSWSSNWTCLSLQRVPLLQKITMALKVN